MTLQKPDITNSTKETKPYKTKRQKKHYYVQCPLIHLRPLPGLLLVLFLLLHASAHALHERADALQRAPEQLFGPLLYLRSVSPIPRNRGIRHIYTGLCLNTIHTISTSPRMGPPMIRYHAHGGLLARTSRFIPKRLYTTVLEPPQKVVDKTRREVTATNMSGRNINYTQGRGQYTTAERERERLQNYRDPAKALHARRHRRGPLRLVDRDQAKLLHSPSAVSPQRKPDTGAVQVQSSPSSSSPAPRSPRCSLPRTRRSPWPAS